MAVKSLKQKHVEVGVRERRDNWDLRKRVDQMGPDERAWALLTDWQTGIGNRRAWDEREPLPVQVALDVDNLKAMNDRWGHDAGDALLAAVCRALEQAGVVPYRIGGDEFACQFNDQDEAFRCLQRANSILRQFSFSWLDTFGTRWTGRGAGFSAGVGLTARDAERSLLWVKKVRERLGLRARRGRLSPLFKVAGVQTWPSWLRRIVG